MTKKVLFFIFCLFISAPSFATNYCEDANCQGCWLFSEGSGTSVADSSANSNTCNVAGTVGSIAWEAVDKPAGASYAMTLDGDGEDILNCGSDASLDDITTGTYVLWLKIGAIGAYARFFGKSSYFNNTDRGVSNYDGSSQLGMRDMRATTQRHRTIDFSGYLSSWTHVAITFSNSINYTDINVYINGTLIESYSREQNGEGDASTDASNSWIFAQDPDGLSSGNDIIMSEAAVFNRVLSSSEISDIYTNGLAQSSVRRRLMIIN